MPGGQIADHQGDSTVVEPSTSTQPIETVIEFDFAVDLTRFRQLANLVFNTIKPSTATTVVAPSS